MGVKVPPPLVSRPHAEQYEGVRRSEVPPARLKPELAGARSFPGSPLPSERAPPTRLSTIRRGRSGVRAPSHLSWPSQAFPLTSDTGLQVSALQVRIAKGSGKRWRRSRQPRRSRTSPAPTRRGPETLEEVLPTQPSPTRRRPLTWASAGAAAWNLPASHRRTPRASGGDGNADPTRPAELCPRPPL